MKLVKVASALLLTATLFSACGRTVQPVGTSTQSLVSPILQSPYSTFIFKTGTSVSTPTILPTATEDWYSATSNAISTLVELFPGHCGMEDAFSHFNITSPDGIWLANYCSPYKEARLKIIKRDGSKTWVVNYKEIKLEYRTDFPNIEGLIPFHWTKDSRYLYFYRVICCIEPYWPTLDTYHDQLYRIDVQTGIWSKVFNGISHSNLYSFSPTDRRLLYIDNHRPISQPYKINIIDLPSGETSTITLNGYTETGGIAWSEDGLSFAIAALKIDESHTKYLFSVFVYYIDTHSLKQIIPQSSIMCIPQKWTSNNYLILKCYQLGSDFYEVISKYEIMYSMNSGLYTTITPSP